LAAAKQVHRLDFQEELLKLSHYSYLKRVVVGLLLTRAEAPTALVAEDAAENTGPFAPDSCATISING
jgi:hypothetical protein